MSLSEREVVIFITSFTGLIEGTEHADYLMPLKCDVLTYHAHRCPPAPQLSTLQSRIRAASGLRRLRCAHTC